MQADEDTKAILTAKLNDLEEVKEFIRLDEVKEMSQSSVRSYNRYKIFI